jgi:predicted ribosome quality control (RQC) complex YloA/Tae2 family protein
LHERYDLLKRLHEDVTMAETRQAWDEFLARNRDRLAKAGFPVSTGSKPAEHAPPFRVFTVEGGFQVWAGKDSRNNDLLTMKHARPNDLWFHARGSGGSHVVLRMGSGKGEVSKRAIEQAAAIAAYYSKMKSSKLVPVAMTQRKYVRKPRGAPAGTVAVEREKVLLVEPALPGEKDS